MTKKKPNSSYYSESQLKMVLKNKPTITSKNWVVWDCNSESVLYGEKFCVAKEVASLTKLMTLLVVCKYIEKLKIQPTSYR
jgi:D-alanyl-D-alanine carboxypeptidase